MDTLFRLRSTWCIDVCISLEQYPKYRFLYTSRGARSVRKDPRVLKQERERLERLRRERELAARETRRQEILQRKREISVAANQARVFDPKSLRFTIPANSVPLALSFTYSFCLPLRLGVHNVSKLDHHAFP